MNHHKQSIINHNRGGTERGRRSSNPQAVSPEILTLFPSKSSSSSFLKLKNHFPPNRKASPPIHLEAILRRNRRRKRTQGGIIPRRRMLWQPRLPKPCERANSLDAPAGLGAHRGTSLTKTCTPIGPYRRSMPRVLGGS